VNTISRDIDRNLLSDIPDEKIADFIFLHLRNMWAVDGLYFLGIEEQFDTDAATDIDRTVWEVMGKIEARRLKHFFDITGNDISSMIQALRYSSWTLDLEDKEIIVEKEKAIVRNVKCRVQNTRIKKDLIEFPCKNVRWGFLKSFAYEFNPNIEVKCNICPPDKHPSNLWCEWEFTMKKPSVN
jgi:hypothetical protein